MDVDVLLFGVKAAPLDDSIYTWHENKRRPKGTTNQEGVFHMQIVYPHNYPSSPPSITLTSKSPNPDIFGIMLCLGKLEVNTTGESVWIYFVG